MAELLLHRTGRGSPSDDSDWQPLDVVVVSPDEHSWGGREVGPGTSFILVKLPGVDVAVVENLLESAGGTAFTKRRSRKFNVASLPNSFKALITVNPDFSVDITADVVTVTGLDQDALLAAVELK